VPGDDRCGHGRRDSLRERRSPHRQDHRGRRGHDAILPFHNLEWIPSFEDPVGDYNLNTDAGVRATIIGGLFSEAKVEARQDSTPAPGNEETDVRYLLSLGWTF